MNRLNLLNPASNKTTADIAFISEKKLSSENIQLKTTFMLLLLLSTLFFLPSAFSNQIPDFSYTPGATNSENTPAPIILFDTGHNNVHSMNQSYYAFTKLLTADGYNIRAIDGAFVDDPTLDHAPIFRKQNGLPPLSDFQQQRQLANILVIVSACSALPCNTSSNDAFTDEEVTEIRQWVEQGGSLFLIFDHPPFSNVVNLASAFGITLGPINDDLPGQLIFATPEFAASIDIGGGSVNINGTLFPSASVDTLNETSDLVLGRNQPENINYVKSFTGYGFTISQTPPADTTYEPLMTFSGVSQGMALRVGAGKIYISGEAAMFSAQLASPDHSATMGFQDPLAEFNQQYLKNIIHWLDGRMSAISGQITLSDGTGVSGVTVNFTNISGGQWSTVTDSNGYYISPRGVSNNTYLVAASSDAYDFSNNSQLVFLKESPARNRDFSAVPK